MLSYTYCFTFIGNSRKPTKPINGPYEIAENNFYKLSPEELAFEHRIKRDSNFFMFLHEYARYAADPKWPDFQLGSMLGGKSRFQTNKNGKVNISSRIKILWKKLLFTYTLLYHFCQR